MMIEKDLEVQARDYLNDVIAPGECTFKVLIAVLVADNPGSSSNDIYKGLARLAKYELADCCHQGTPEVRKSFGKLKTVHPLIWHASRGERKERPSSVYSLTCPHCGKPIEIKS